jgi:hypothetical protein
MRRIYYKKGNQSDNKIVIHYCFKLKKPKEST